MTMKEYNYCRQTFDKRDGTVSLPEDAIGTTVSYSSALGSVEYLVPVGERCPECGSKDLTDRESDRKCNLCGREWA